MSNRAIKVTQNVGGVKEGGTVIGVQVIQPSEPILTASLEDVQFHGTGPAKIEFCNHWADEFSIHEYCLGYICQ